MQQSENERWMKRAAEIMHSHVQTSTPLTYQELALGAQIPPPHRIHKLTMWLEQTMEADSASSRPMRAVIVVSKTNHLPASGFFDKACDLGVLDWDADLPARRLWYKQHLAQAAAFYQR